MLSREINWFCNISRAGVALKNLFPSTLLNLFLESFLGLSYQNPVAVLNFCVWNSDENLYDGRGCDGGGG